MVQSSKPRRKKKSTTTQRKRTRSSTSRKELNRNIDLALSTGFQEYESLARSIPMPLAYRDPDALLAPSGEMYKFGPWETIVSWRWGYQLSYKLFDKVEHIAWLVTRTGTKLMSWASEKKQKILTARAWKVYSDNDNILR